MRTTRATAPDDAISAALFGKVRRLLLAWLFLHPDESFYVRQLVRIVGGSPGDVPRELRRLAGVGLLTRSARGREIHYQVNRRSPVFEELRRLMTKTAGKATPRE